MNKILGSLLLLPMMLFASYSWKMTIEDDHYFKDEPFLVTFECQFDGRFPDFYIDFKPHNEGMLFERLSYTDDVIENKRRVIYRYVARVLKAGKRKVAIEVLMRETTEASIKDTTIGRDNNRELVFKDTKVFIQPVSLEILPTHLDTSVVGDFVIEERVSHDTIDAYKPLQLVRTIKGVGNFKALPPMKLEIEGVKIFANEVSQKLTLTPKGYEGKMVWRYALIGDTNYTVPALRLPFFSTKTKQLSVVETDEHAIVVKPTFTKAELIDTQEYPQARKVIEYGLYLKQIAIFLLGMLTLLLAQKVYRVYKKERPKAWYETVKEVDELQLLLISKDSRRYQPLIEMIDDHRQEKKLKPLKYYKIQLKTLED